VQGVVFIELDKQHLGREGITCRHERALSAAMLDKARMGCLRVNYRAMMNLVLGSCRGMIERRERARCLLIDNTQVASFVIVNDERNNDADT